MLYPGIDVRSTRLQSQNCGYMTFRTPETAPAMKWKLITGGRDKHRSRPYPTVPLVCRGLQPTGLICHVEVFQVTMTTEENPAQVTEFPVLPSTNPSCALHINPLGTAESESDGTDRSTSNPKRTTGGGILEESAHHCRC